MRRGEITLCCVGVGVAAFLQYYDLLFLMLFLVFLIVICVLGIYLSVSWSLGRGKQYKPLSQPTEPKNVKKLLEQMMVNVDLLLLHLELNICVDIGGFHFKPHMHKIKQCRNLLGLTMYFFRALEFLGVFRLNFDPIPKIAKRLVFFP